MYGRESRIKFQFYFSRLLQSFDAATVVSLPELKRVEQITPRQVGKVFILPNGVRVEEYIKVETKPNPTRLIYSGSFRYYANYEAMTWFVGEIFPRVLDKFPEVHLYITGDHASLSLPSSRNVILAGHVDNYRELLGSAWVSIAPLKSGGGTRLKVLQAMAIGVPVVATSKGAEGLDAIPGTHFFLGDTAQEFADQVLRLLVDPTFAKR